MTLCAVSYPTPQDPWHATQPLPTAPPSHRVRRLRPKQLAGLLIGAFFVLCCGGLTIGAIADSDSAPSSKDLATTAADAERAGSTPATTAPSAQLVPATASPSPGSATADQAAVVPPALAKTVKPKPKPVYYANCDAVRGAGKAPLRKGRPGYRPGLDRDGDGVACESREGNGSSGGGSNGGGSDGGGSDGGGNSSAGTDPRFATCKAAKAAGYGPYQQGVDPEYSWYRDSDHDGRVCE